jgi:hypothetical protein
MIWKHGASDVSFGTKPTFQAMEGGKDENPTYFNPTGTY